MSPLDGPLGQLAATLIDSVGLGSRPATLVRSAATGDGYNASAGTPTSYPCRVVLSSYDRRMIDGTLIQANDKRAIAARVTLGVEPDPARDTLRVGTDTFQIVAVMGYSSGEEEAAYEMQVRR